MSTPAVHSLDALRANIIISITAPGSPLLMRQMYSISFQHFTFLSLSRFPFAPIYYLFNIFRIFNLPSFLILIFRNFFSSLHLCGYLFMQNSTLIIAYISFTCVFPITYWRWNEIQSMEDGRTKTESRKKMNGNNLIRTVGMLMFQPFFKNSFDCGVIGHWDFQNFKIIYIFYLIMDEKSKLVLATSWKYRSLSYSFFRTVCFPCCEFGISNMSFGANHYWSLLAYWNNRADSYCATWMLFFFFSIIAERCFHCLFF